MADQNEDAIPSISQSSVDPADDLAGEEIQDFRFLASLSGYVARKHPAFPTVLRPLSYTIPSAMCNQKGYYLHTK